MKWISWCAVIVFLAAAARAQVASGTVEVGVGGGRLFSGTLARGSNAYFNRAVKVDDAVLKGFWFSAQVTPNYALEVAVRRTPTRFTEAFGGVFPTNGIVETIDFASIEVGGLRVWPIGNFVPYAGGGFGITSLDINASTPAVQDSNRVAIATIVGAKYYLIRSFGVRFDVRERVTRLSNDHWLRSPEVMAGAFVSFRHRP
jgi:outer membrane protein W